LGADDIVKKEWHLVMFLTSIIAS